MKNFPAFIILFCIAAGIVFEKTLVAEKQINVSGIAVSPEGAFDIELKTPEPGKRHTLKITPKSTASPVTARIVLKTDFPKDAAERFVIVAAVK